ncbi:LysR family transcriptional regulator [Paraburkholderia silvatlantica]|uniref:DNA-binding transcriptional LysR family regulator n=1 Tax=Paraburkholderia silvatlantica TaxID=321895 RepID=A0A2U1AN57_9BURK|nr:LysR family transcriptional regulator [Paraburkholderia silvatlantica]MBB2926605.1 DNA-binding transcriptional LysR family regulator [Paraburkholderia silvatlantica]PVY37757.1 LysR family transcriptional regulator [Paraburkholderia silvatlantica]PXW42721.1 LysR family transcriptional regulator [Paraburkholderia silvatlantica]PYE13224.1 LysR family transcriptional regulator [Paraburkholderia silvatlantica]TDR04862.1 LysR family transcriptional regulator [Paraburkholderia silvatlantica]
MSKPTLADLQAFRLVAERRSFARAAGELGVSRSALSHAMRGLESDLGVRLLHRTTRSVSPTQAGERLLARLGPLLSDLDHALDEVARDDKALRGTLRINGSDGAIRHLLRTVVPRFVAMYPDMELDLVADGRLVDVIAEGFDAGVRLGEAVPKDMIAVRVSDDLRFLAVASPRYLRRHGRPAVPEDLHAHQCVRQRLPSGKRYRWEFARHDEEYAIDPPGALTLDSSTLMVEAAIDGLGIAYVPESYARDALARKRLVAVLSDWCPVIPGLFLYFPGNRHVPTGLQAFVNLLRERDPAVPEG